MWLLIQNAEIVEINRMSSFSDVFCYSAYGLAIPVVSQPSWQMLLHPLNQIPISPADVFVSTNTFKLVDTFGFAPNRNLILQITRANLVGSIQKL